MAEEVRLRDGTKAIIWSLLPSDREALREEYEHLSPESRFHRFMAGVPHLTDPMLDRLVDDVDGINHVALVLFALPDEGPEVPAGIARIVRYEDRPFAADVAVTVADEWQGRGVASVLLQALMRQRPKGLTQIVTQIASDNAAALAMLEPLGGVTVTDVGCGVLKVEIELPDPT